MTLEALIDCFMLAQRLRSNSKATQANYARFLGMFSAYVSTLGITTAEGLTLAAVQGYQLTLMERPSRRDPSRKLSSKTVQTCIRHVKCFLRWAFDEEMINVDVAKKIKLPKAKKPAVEILTDREAAELLGSFNQRDFIGLRDYTMCLLMLDCGLRVSEICRLSPENVNLEIGYAKVLGKGDKERIVPLGLKSRQTLAKFMFKRQAHQARTSQAQPSLCEPFTAFEPTHTKPSALFLTRTGAAMTASAVELLFRRLRKKLLMPRLHAHLLRHTFATNFLLAGLGDVYQLAQLLGHESVSTTEIYLHAANYYRMIAGGNHSPTYADLKSVKS